MPRSNLKQAKPSQVIRALVTLLGRGEVFNDRIQGGQSIKVWGWDESIYNEAMRILSRHGYRVRKVTTPCKSIRLHVFPRTI